MLAEDVSREILAMERAAFDRLGKGDPDGFLEISDPDVVYFDPFQPRRIDGLENLRRYYSEMRGKIQIDSYGIVDPKIQMHGEIAVLTFRFDSRGSEWEMHWNTTEIYRRTDQGWRIIHSHWSFTQPKLAN